MPEQQPTPQIFLSFDDADAAFVGWLADALTALGHHLSLPREAIRSGAPSFERLQQAMEAAQVMLLVITPAALKSRVVNSAWMYFAAEADKRLIPILLEALVPPDKINFMLAALEHADFSKGDHELALGNLQRMLHEAYESLERGPAPRREAILPSYRTPSPEQANDVLEPKDAGLAGVHLRMPLDRFGAWLRQARHTVRVLNTWTGVFVEHGELLVEALRRGATVQLLLLHPSSPFARQRTIDMNPARANPAADEDEVPHNIRTSIRQIASVFPEAQGTPGRLELRLYNVLPSFSIHQCDSTALVGFFAHASRTTTFPMLEAALESPFGKHIEAEFAQLWNHATVVDLLHPFAAESDAANEALAAPLSARELEILVQICAGLSNQEIADRLVVTVATVKKHINSLYSKLGVTSRARAILRGQALGLARPVVRPL